MTRAKTKLTLVPMHQDFSQRYSTIQEAFENASRHLTGAMRGASWRETQTPRLRFLPPSNGNSYENSFHYLYKSGAAAVMARPRRGEPFNWFGRPEWQLQHYMQAIRETVTVSFPAGGLYRANGFILRPASLLIIRHAERYAGKLEERTGDIVFRDDATGHERLEEIAAIEADFPGIFHIRG